MQSPRSSPRAHQHLNLARRSAVACNRCRSRKTKCAGTPPHACVACRNTRRTCTYPSSERKVTVPESYFLELQARARASNSQPVDTHAESGPAESTENVWALTETGNCPMLPQLPPYEHAKRLYQGQHAYLGTIFSFVRDPDFYRRLDMVYSRPPNVGDREDCLVYCQMLLVFGFGQMYSVNQWIGDDGPPGFFYFKHALKFLPEAYEDGSILFVEVLSYVAYFLQALNRRDSAYIYIGLALRMAVSLGLHQEVMDQAISTEEREHRRRVWWSVYSLDRLLSLTLGRPFSIQDVDINLALPGQVGDEDPRVSSILACYAQLSRIQGTIGEEIYRNKQTSSSSLFASAQRIMRSLSDWFGNLPEELRINTSSPPTGLSRGIISTQLHYYHCINMTVRPLLLYAVQRQMAANIGPSSRSIWAEGLQSNIMGIIDTSIAAARSSMALWKMAAEYNLVGK
ncbi:Transcriptional activator [Aspergillus melleus]|uniref:Transcriptional activator n=1 Tax=Aspergillus melleus TaxID=138277 RepID=A0ACC3B8B9_9EURO|nr:Transcriptional activator [Aspergillus melleus]